MNDLNELAQKFFIKTKKYIDGLEIGTIFKIDCTAEFKKFTKEKGYDFSEKDISIGADMAGKSLVHEYECSNEFNYENEIFQVTI